MQPLVWSPLRRSSMICTPISEICRPASAAVGVTCVAHRRSSATFQKCCLSHRPMYAPHLALQKLSADW